MTIDPGSTGPSSAWPRARFTLERTMVDGHALRRRRAAADDDRPTLLYIHGLGESALCFERLLCHPRLDGWSHVAPDLLGYGKSAWTSEPRDLDRHADDLVRLLDRLEIDRVVLVGHSMGGVIGTTLAERAPDRVAGFADVEGNISPDDCTISALAAPYHLDDWLDRGVGSLLDHLDAASDATFATDDRHVLRTYQASLQLADPRAIHRNGRDLVDISADGRLATRLAALDVPTVYLHGHPRGTGARSLELLEQAGVATVALEPAGHWPFLDQPHAFAIHLVDFLREIAH